MKKHKKLLDELLELIESAKDAVGKAADKAETAADTIIDDDPDSDIYEFIFSLAGDMSDKAEEIQGLIDEFESKRQTPGDSTPKQSYH